MASESMPPCIVGLLQSLQPSSDWTIRVQALRTIAEWATWERSQSSHCFLNGVHELRDAIANHVCDLRSAVVKEACATIAVLASTMKEAAFQAHIDVFLSSLLKAVVASIEVVAQAADDCIRTMLQNTRTGHYSVLPKLTEAAASKSPTLRRVCIEYFDVITVAWNAKFLLRHNVPDCMAKHLLLGLCDANSAVRASSRKTFWTFQARFPGKAKLVWEKLEYTTKSALLQGGSVAAFDDKSIHSPHESDVSSQTSYGLSAVFARLYQPHYFQDRALRLAKLKEEQDLRLCTFTPAKRRLQRTKSSKGKALSVTLPSPPPYAEIVSKRHASTVACS
ncbi:hypothetical protein SDRG_08678 [Saprolegnia diclina VS20]|uniref:TOG domain-containing protein n=1 Tax=Saprolegnia diclina (strain VS20) TaxID=1156394 RepID=T0Q824_SAPDV|nr:hypothetical protein SDRG_08678 [Saprolegnia diclina VS20]EQC33999.1 hypothetical protein SDRG_08678 [Saprolegnia diclina VS20]|eukprot:XP_008612794.1 hypothetical protein SDRG_08678 [Saprolegnia diclina VS20]